MKKENGEMGSWPGLLQPHLALPGPVLGDALAALLLFKATESAPRQKAVEPALAKPSCYGSIRIS